jgi:hypothetical protein
MEIEDPGRGNGTHAPLRFAIISSGLCLERWQVDGVEQLLAPGNTQLALHIAVHGRGSPGLSARFPGCPPPPLLFLWYRRLCLRPAANRLAPFWPAHDQIPVVACRVARRQAGSYELSKEGLQAIGQCDLDFILHFAALPLGGEVLRAARYGVWALHPGDPERVGSPPGFWEVFHGEPVTGAVLKRLTDHDDPGAVLRKGFLKTIQYSPSRNINTILFECARWPAQICKDLSNDNADYLRAPALAGQTAVPAAKSGSGPLRAGVAATAPGKQSHRPRAGTDRDPPNNRQMVRFFVRIMRNLVVEMKDTFFRHGLWNIGVVHQPMHRFLEPDFHPRVRYLQSDQDREFLADPFGVVHRGKLTILCETLDYRTHKGAIASIELDAAVSGAGERIQPRVVLDFPVHVSYPYLFEYRGDLYCIPETARLGEVSLYRAAPFPDRWTRVATLITGVAALDATVFQHAGLWWLTCTDKAQGAHSKLFIWHAPDLFGPWEPHAANPVKVDVRSARPAGMLFVHRGQLYRPAQDCSHTYGGAIVIQRVTRLTPRQFSEEPVAIVNPDRTGPYPHGIHTLSAAGDLTLIDGKRLVFNAAACRQALKRELGRMLGF